MRLVRVLPFVPPLLCFALVLAYASYAPEPDDWRQMWSEPAFEYDPAVLFDFGAHAKFYVTRVVRLLAFQTGVDFPLLAFVPWMLAVVAFVAIRSLGGRSLGGLGIGGTGLSAVWATLVALLIFAPSFGANWLLFERFRLVLPMACGAVGVLALTRTSIFRRAPPSAAYGFAAMLSAIACFTSESGALLWLALLPLVASCMRSRALFATAMWFLGGNLMTWFCYSAVAREQLGIAGSLWNKPLETLAVVARVTSASLPDLFRDTDIDAYGIAALMLLAFVVGIALLARREAVVRQHALPWITLAAFGFVSLSSVVHARLPVPFVGALLEETCPTAVLLPIGLAGLWAILTPRICARLAAPLAGVILVLLAQDWQAGLIGMRAEHALLRQSEAALVFADVATKELPPAPRSSLHAAQDRARLRKLGLLKRLEPVPGLSMRDLRAAGLVDPWSETRAGPTRAATSAPTSAGSSDRARGEIQRVDDTSAAGIVGGADLVLLVRSLGQDAGFVFAVSAPLLVRDGPSPWSAVFPEAEAFREGELLRAYEFDVRARSIRRIEGDFRFSRGRFVRVEGR